MVETILFFFYLIESLPRNPIALGGLLTLNRLDAGATVDPSTLLNVV